MTVFDVGANIGYFTLLASSLVEGTGRVFAFEPEPENFQLLVKNVELNSCKNVESFNLAVSDRLGRDDLYIADRNKGLHSLRKLSNQHTSSISVKTTTIDQFSEGRPIKPDFFKIDVEGHELHCFRGMEKIIDRNPGVKILVEFSPRQLNRHGSSAEEFLNLIESKGFAVFDANGASGLQQCKRKDLLVRYLVEKGNFTNLYLERI